MRLFTSSALCANVASINIINNIIDVTVLAHNNDEDDEHGKVEYILSGVFEEIVEDFMLENHDEFRVCVKNT